MRRASLVVAALVLLTAACADRSPTTVFNHAAPSTRPTTSAATTSSMPGAITSAAHAATAAPAVTAAPATTPARRRTTATTASSSGSSPSSPSSGPCPVFPADNPWNTDITNTPVNANSANYVASIGASTHLHPDFGTFWEGAPIGIPFVHVGAGQPKVPVSFDYADESDPGPYPIPPDAPIEGGANSTGDRHVLVVDDAGCRLYEMYDSHKQGDGSWHAGSGAVFDLRSNNLRPDYSTSADAAGLPIYAGLVRYDEVQAGVINHALRFTAAKTQRGFIHPATHYASSATDANLPPMGLRFRMKASYSCASLRHEAQVVCAALKRFGMFVADNGSNWYISGQHDSRWNDDALGDIKTIPGSAFDALDTGAIVH